MLINWKTVLLASIATLSCGVFGNVNTQTQESLDQARATARHAIAHESLSWHQPWKVLGFTERPTAEEFTQRYHSAIFMLHTDRWLSAEIPINEEDTDLFVRGLTAIVDAKARFHPVPLDFGLNWRTLETSEMPPYTHVYEDKLALYAFGFDEDGKLVTLIRPKSQRKVPFRTTMRYQMLETKVSMLRLLAQLSGKAYVPDERIEALLKMGDILVMDISHPDFLTANLNASVLMQQFLKKVRPERPDSSCALLKGK